MTHIYFFLMLLSVALQGLFSFFEMACVSFHKIRLQYYVSKGGKRALWIHDLLQNPSRLFGMTLIGITTSLVIGSECARRFYESIHLNPDFAPLSQVFLVVVFAELSPMFAARRHPEQAAMMLAPLMVFISKILSPLIFLFDLISRTLHRWMGKEMQTPLFLTREEVKMAFEERKTGEDEFQTTVSQIFQLKNLTAEELMIPIEQVQMAPSSFHLEDLKHLLSVHYTPTLPIYHKRLQNIVGVVSLKDLIVLDEKKKVIDIAHSPWFVPKNTSILELLEQFRRNNQSTAVILEANGEAIGIISLDQIFTQIFGQELGVERQEMGHYIERTLSAEMSVVEFNRQFEVNLPEGKGDTLSDLILASLEHLPVKGETVRIQDFAFTVEEPTIRGVKTVSVRTIHD